MKFPRTHRLLHLQLRTAYRSQFELVGTKGSITAEPAYELAEGLAYTLRAGKRERRKQFQKSDQFAPELLYFSDCVLQEPPSGAGR